MLGRLKTLQPALLRDRVSVRAKRKSVGNQGLWKQAKGVAIIGWSGGHVGLFKAKHGGGG